MKTYKIKTLDTTDISAADWKEAEAVHIVDYVMSPDYRPLCDARLLCLGGKYLACRMTCHESDPRREHTEYGSLVCQDSCLEFFFGFDFDAEYLNCEFNALGTAIIQYGTQKGPRGHVTEGIPFIRSEILPYEWSVEVYWDIDSLRSLFGEDIDLAPGREFYGNFHKCGDRTEHPHFGQWNPGNTDGPCFHVPACFGKLIIQ